METRRDVIRPLEKPSRSISSNGMEQKALELFSLCDKECKGFITRPEMQRLHGELPMTPEELEQVFDVLDEDGNGRLTLQEFADGFGMFVNIKEKPLEETMDEEILEAGGQSLSTGYGSDDEHFSDLLDSLGAENLFTEEDVIRRMWDYVRREDPVLMNSFQEFLARISKELLDSKTENKSLETMLKSRKHEFNQQMQDLYEEMERQLQSETEQRLAEEKAKEQKLREELEVELNAREEQMQELLDKQAELEKRLQEIQDMENERKKSNILLQQERDMLEHRLQTSESMLNELRNLVENLRKNDLREKRQRVETTWQITEGMTWERDALIKQLQVLRNINKKLLDERDEINILQEQFGRLSAGKDIVFEDDDDDDKQAGYNSSTESERTKSRGSVIADYLDHHCSTPIRHDTSYDLDSPLPADGRGYLDRISEAVDCSSKICSYQENHSQAINSEVENELCELEMPQRMPIKNTASPHVVPKAIHQNTKSESKEIQQRPNTRSNTHLADPDRLFKIVFIGDSGVGKTSFIHRFCHNTFKTTFSATIGMDFRVTSFKADGHLVALQLWDTAGQERFRSITRQYYRKADAVIIMYDVTSETSFKSVRNWINSVKEGAEEDVVLVLVGNKTDLCESEEHRVVRKKDGSDLAKEYSALFYEVSARTGQGITESISGMCSMLQVHEDRRIERALQLHKQAKKKSCC